VNKILGYGLCLCGCGSKTRIAPYCDKNRGWIKGEPLRYITHHNTFKNKPRVERTYKGGYSLVISYNHPRTLGDGQYVPEHILVAEKALGKPLPEKAVVHHYGELNENNKIVICQDQGYHMLLHTRAKALKECGHAGWRKCWLCKTYDDPVRMVENKKINYHSFYHRECKREYDKSRRLLCQN
jgi:hypothetical protein